ncbi:hypothetical protein F469_04868, partial [Pseudomonas sp. URMO17WK12:I2]
MKFCSIDLHSNNSAKKDQKGDRFIFRDYASVCPDLVVQPAALGFFLFHP